VTPLLASVWDFAAAAGGSLALTFLVALVLAIVANAVLFVGSAVVVLDRFARTARRWRSVAVVTLGWAAMLSGLGTGAEAAEAWTDALAPLGVAWEPGPLAAWALSAACGLVLVALAELLMAGVLRFLRPAALGSAAVVLPGLGVGLALGALDQPGFALAPAALAAAIWAALRQRRRRRAARAPGGEERLAARLALALAPGALLPLALAEPRPELADAGLALVSAFLAAVLLGLLPLAAAGLLDARGSAEWFVATRYLFAKRRQTFVSVITIICIAGVAAGVWLIITVLSVMNGFERTWREEIIGNRAHFTVHSPLGPIEDYPRVLQTLEGVRDVVGASPYVDGEGLVRGSGGEIVGVRVRGIDPERIGQVTDLREDLLPGSEHALEALHAEGRNGDSGDPGIIVGSQLAALVGVRVGDPLVLISPFGGPPTPLGPGPRLKPFRVVGVFQSSFFQYDEVFTYTSLAAAQDFRRVGDVVHGIEVRTTDYYRSRRVAREAEARLGFPYFTRDWKEFFPAFFQALKTERVMMFVLLTMIMVVAAFAIVVTLIMMIMEKSSDIAILKAMGATDAAVERIFAIEGTLIGVVGTGLGVVAGVAVTTQLAWVQQQIEALTGIDTLPATVYQFSTLPWEIDAGQVAIVVALAMVLALGATLLPSRQGAQLDPAEALRYE
jgi:lipoprotein-releasing system permease protein